MSSHAGDDPVAGVRRRVREGGLLTGERGVVAMISGGRDSTCLLDVAVALRGAGAVSALHVNYGLREAAGADERQCCDLCEQLGVSLRVVRERGGPPARGNLHAWARELRYRAAEQDSRQRDALIATGHTASDQAETILYRLAASPGRRALLGMNARDTSPGARPLVRPLLQVTREQTAEYCRARALRWREDESNDDPAYARARVRNGLLAALRAVHPAAQENVLRTASLLREEAELLDALIARELAGEQQIALSRLAQLPPPLARGVVVRLAEQAAGDFVPQAGARVAELLALGRRGGRAELHLGGRAAAVIERGELRMIRLPAREQR